jgi:pteridine reductase
MPSIWLDEELTSVSHYRSAYHAAQQREIYGTDAPVVLVTGSSSARVGGYVARYFLCHGYRVVFHANGSVEEGRKCVQACDQAGLQAMLVCGNVTDQTSVSAWFPEIDARFGRLDAVVHCASQWQMQSLEQTGADDVMDCLRNHVLGAFLVAKHGGLQMTRQTSGGSIVLTGDWAVQRPYPGFSGYFAGKGSIPTLTRTLAAEMASRNARVRANAILPGIVLLGGYLSKSDQQNLERAALVNRIGTPLDVAKAAMFLCESTFVSGECVHVDGGRHCYASSDVDAIAHPDYPH